MKKIEIGQIYESLEFIDDWSSIETVKIFNKQDDKIFINFSRVETDDNQFNLFTGKVEEYGFPEEVANTDIWVDLNFLDEFELLQ